MDERKTPTYFEVVDFVDRILPSKEDMDYTKITAEDLLKRFNDEVKESGFYFEAGHLEVARNIIRRCFANTYGRESNYVSGRSKSFDQYNYYIQNQLSQARASLIKTLANPRQLVDTSYDSASFHREMGTTEELRPRFTSDRVESYVRTVLHVSWETEGRMEIEADTLTADILAHFGLLDYGNLGYTKLGKKVSSVLERFRASTLVAHGNVSEDGYFVTKDEEYQRNLDYTVSIITDIIYENLSKAFKNTQKWEERRKLEEQEELAKRAVETEEPLVSENVSVDKSVSEDVSVDNSTPSEGQEISIEELEGVISSYEELQRKIAENIELTKELAALIQKENEIRNKIAQNENAIKRGISK